MNKSFITVLLAILFSNVAVATPISHISTNSLSKAVLEIMAMNTQHLSDVPIPVPYSNESEKNNSLFRAVLARHEAQMKLSFNSEAQVYDSNDVSTNDQYNSLSGAVLRKQARDYRPN